MNQKFTSRGYAFVVSFLLFALLVSACGTSDTDVQATVNAAVLTAAPASGPAATMAPAAPAPSGECEDGKIVANQAVFITRVPLGTAEGEIVAELSWTGKGFGGYDRAVVIIPKLADTRYAIHARNPKTVHEVQYCGTDQAINEWAPTHVDAMVISAQADDGSRPDPQEIGVYRLNLDGTLTEIRPGPKGPGLAAIQQRLVVSVNP